MEASNSKKKEGEGDAKPYDIGASEAAEETVETPAVKHDQAEAIRATTTASALSAETVAEGNDAMTHAQDKGSEEPVATLAVVFPDTPKDIIHEVLLAHHGNVEEATETLLAMSDPAFSEPTQPQVDSDAELARRLQAEDSAATSHRTQWQAPSARRPQNTSGSPAPLSYQPYVPKRGRLAGSGTPATTGSGTYVSSPVDSRQNAAGANHEGGPKDELELLTENFSKLAEQGKKTLGGFFNKVKEQINKIDAQNGSTSAPSTSSAFDSHSSTLPPQLPAKLSYQQDSKSSTSHQQQQRPMSTIPEPLPRPAAARSPVVSSVAKEGTPLPDAPVASSSKDLPSTSSPQAEATSPAVPEEPKKDFSKIGLLPRQSINLKQKKDGNESDESDDLEYVRSPFDDD